MRKKVSKEAISRELVNFCQWFIERNVQGCEGVNSQLYLAMKRDFISLMAWLNIEPQDLG